VLPSRSEAFPNAVLEAMAAGLPIVASGVGGILELIDDGRTGVLVPPGDAGALADGCAVLLADPPLAARLGDAARAQAHAGYSFDRMVGAFEHLYLTHLAPPRRRPAARAQQLAAFLMCGIAGKFNFDPNRAIDRERLTAMTSVIAHRGPDADGFYLGAGIGLGHRRLSIIDLSTGDQPLANEDRTIWVIFNGEIYNFADVRIELEAHGHRFRTHSDTEVIVTPTSSGATAPSIASRGMFAFALWDEPKRRLLLVRDRLGVKPLYYSPTPAGVTFGSEIKALLEDPDVPARLERRRARRLSHAAVRPVAVDDVSRRAQASRRAPARRPSAAR
jgi:hypothetical protein